MTLGEKFESGKQFVKYAEVASGMNFDDKKVINWFDNNKDFKLTYTGIMKVLNRFKVEKPTEETTEED